MNLFGREVSDYLNRMIADFRLESLNWLEPYDAKVSRTVPRRGN